ncbi:secondary thiamine-phosphate synthase enzyme YjbQ [Telmatospirillum sp. J64-1]|uniref:secondary thiamine-phosphate synthase enzyme YjbQ n=1 Tax=Telmatospirillum sp. J64-1 TaxID=2502183 RepID=UPI00115E9B72|nr:secondary thiamine-phosphate synthase enzyme YjbQ [Telmatospirillum sp. J64-1]
MKQQQIILTVRTEGRGLLDVTAPVQDWVRRSGIQTGLLTVFIQHTSASLTIQENADPDVCRDLESFMERVAPEDPSLYRHGAEGPDDMPAHIRSALTDVSLSIPVSGGRMALGTWQGLYVFEHRRRGHERRLVLHLLGQ